MDTLHQLDDLLHWSLYQHVGNQFTEHVHGRVLSALDAGTRRREALSTPDELSAYCAEMRNAFLSGVGGLPESVPLEPTITGRIVDIGYAIEKVIFQAREGVYITGNLYLPDGLVAPSPAILFCCGHHQQAKAVAEYQSVCLHLIQAGFVVLAFDPIGQGERESYLDPATGVSGVRWGSGEHDYAGAQCWPLGNALARYFLHDAMRAFDYLASRPEVDSTRIGVTGNSGGGYQTALLMLCEPRVAAAAPATYLTGRREYLAAGEQFDAEQIFPEIGILGYDHDDFLLGMAPKPVLVLAASSDFFPIDGTRRTVERCRHAWELFDRGDDVALFIDNAPHAYTTAMACAASDFFHRHLRPGKVKGNTSTTAVTCREPASLKCTASGSVRGDFPAAKFIFEENQQLLNVLESARAAMPLDARRERLTAWLREKIMSNRCPVDIAPRQTLDDCYAGLAVTFRYWWSQQGITNCAVFFRDMSLIGHCLPATIAIWNGGTKQLVSHMHWIRRECSSGRAVMVLDVTGTGQLAPLPFNKYPDPDFVSTTCMLACNLISLGDSLPALRTWDVLRAVEVVEAISDLNANSLEVYGHGSHALYARLAGAIEPRIRCVTCDEEFTGWSAIVRSRYYEPADIMSVLLPGVLAHGDLDELRHVVTSAKG